MSLLDNESIFLPDEFNCTFLSAQSRRSGEVWSGEGTLASPRLPDHRQPSLLARTLYAKSIDSYENRGGEVIFMGAGARQRMNYCWQNVI